MRGIQFLVQELLPDRRPADFLVQLHRKAVLREEPEFLRREKWLTGTMYGSEDPAVALPILLEHVRAGRLDLASLVGPVYTLDDADAAIQASLAGASGRVLVTP